MFLLFAREWRFCALDFLFEAEREVFVKEGYTRDASVFLICHGDWVSSGFQRLHQRVHNSHGTIDAVLPNGDVKARLCFGSDNTSLVRHCALEAPLRSFYQGMRGINTLGNHNAI